MRESCVLWRCCCWFLWSFFGRRKRPKIEFAEMVFFHSSLFYFMESVKILGDFMDSLNILMDFMDSVKFNFIENFFVLCLFFLFD